MSTWQSSTITENLEAESVGVPRNRDINIIGSTLGGVFRIILRRLFRGDFRMRFGHSTCSTQGGVSLSWL